MEWETVYSIPHEQCIKALCRFVSTSVVLRTKIEIQGRQAKDIKLSATQEATQDFMRIMFSIWFLLFYSICLIFFFFFFISRFLVFFMCFCVLSVSSPIENRNELK